MFAVRVSVAGNVNTQAPGVAAYALANHSIVGAQRSQSKTKYMVDRYKESEEHVQVVCRIKLLFCQCQCLSQAALLVLHCGDVVQPPHPEADMLAQSRD